MMPEPLCTVYEYLTGRTLRLDALALANALDVGPVVLRGAGLDRDLTVAEWRRLVERNRGVRPERGQ